MRKKECLKEEKGITLLALVVTIIVLLILAGVSLNLVAGAMESCEEPQQL